MKAMVLTGIRQMEFVQVADPAIRQDEDVLLKVEAVGICGSDVHYYANGRIGSQVVQYPYRIGHEFAASVVDVGPAVTRVAPGDRVAVDPAISCGHCDQCMAGRFHTCRDLSFLGCPDQAEGCLCEYIVMPEASCHKLSSDTNFEQAALVEPLSIGVYAIQQSIPMQEARIGILGCGPIGLSVLLVARHAGAEKIYATDKIDARCDLAIKSGAAWAVNPDKRDAVSEVTKQEPMLLDAVFECCGQQEALDQAVEMLKPGGKLMVIGIPRGDRVSFPIDQLRRKEICIQNVRRQNECVREAIDLIECGDLDADFMITHRFPFENTRVGFDLVDQYADGVLKAMIRMA